MLLRTLIFLLLSTPIISYAQKVPTIQIGRMGKETPVTQTGIVDSVYAATFREDPVIFINSSYGNYEVNRYELSYLPRRGELIGPIKVSGDKAYDIKWSMRNYFSLDRLHHGDRLYIESINARCTDSCAVPELKIKNIIVIFR